jgi:2-(1,2-epoxy-1,2-dihydrophenyl)acetyl-CoA isomerase
MIGTARAWRLATSGAPLSALEAMDLGMLDACVPAEDFGSTWLDFATSLAEGPTQAFAQMKLLMYSASSATIFEQLDREVGAQATAGATEDHLEGVQAFLQKRQPDFKGR